MTRKSKVVSPLLLALFASLSCTKDEPADDKPATDKSSVTKRSSPALEPQR